MREKAGSQLARHSHSSEGQKGYGLGCRMSSNPCLTFLLVYSVIVSIALIITSTLLATSHSTVVCKGDREEVVVNHYSVVDESEDKVVEGQPEDCKCHCNCSSEEMVTGVEVFILTSVGILVLSLTFYNCIALRFLIQKREKRNTKRAELEKQKVNTTDVYCIRSCLQNFVTDGSTCTITRGLSLLFAVTRC